MLVALTLVVASAAIVDEDLWLADHAPDHELLTLSDGLSDSTVFSIDQDALGRIWFGTASGGANVYNGHLLTAFLNDTQPDSLSHGAAGQVFVDSRGDVYVGTWGGGLNRMVSTDGRFERINPESPPARIQTIFEDRQDRLWIGSGDAGLFRYWRDGRFESVSTTDGAPLERIWNLVQDEQDRIWVAADSGLFELIDDRLSAVPFNEKVGDEPRALTVVDGRLWIGGNNGLYVMSSGQDTLESVPLDTPTINVLESAPNGDLLIGTLAGLYAVNPGNRELTAPLEAHQLRLFPDRNIRDIFFDSTGVVWLATREAGVIKMVGSHSGFHGFSTIDQLETVDTIVELGPQELLIGSRRGLWLLRQTESGPNFSQIPDTESMSVNQLINGPNRIWVATRAGLFSYDPETRAINQEPRFADLDDVSITTMHAADDGSFWIGTWSLGLYHYPENDGPRIRYWSGGEPALPDDFISVIVPDTTGGLWLGHWYEGVSRLDLASGSLVNLKSDRHNPAALPSGHVHSMVVDEESAWVGTSFGFARLDLQSHRVARIGVAREDRPTSVQRMLDDENGALWLATTRGIKRLDKESGRLIHFGTADGLVSTEFYARSGARGAAGHFYFGGIGGVVSFLPSEIADQFSPPAVFIYQVSVDGASLPISGESIEIPAGTRRLQFDFLAADFKAPEENRYRYRLAGEDQDWTPVGSANAASYAALPYGDYRFAVRASNSNGIWSATDAAELEVRVLPFWWQTLGGRAAIVAALLLLTYGWHRLRTARIRAANRRLEAEVARQTRDLQHANQNLAVAALTDFLTGLPNRRGFIAQLEEAKGQVKGSIAIGDVDNFKSFNDRFGHETGDLVLKHVADCVASAVRPQDLVARWGGEEFIFFFAGTDLDEAERIAERVRRMVETMDPKADHALDEVRITLGVAERVGDESLDNCIDRADQGLYQGKQSGKNQVVRAA